MKNKPVLQIVVSIMILITSCDDFIEKDLTNRHITVLTPADNSISSTYTQLFMWDDLEGASEYHIQIVKPSFSVIQQFIADTTVHYNQFAITLQPGHYQWRIKGENGSSSTSYQTYTFTIDSTNDLSNQTVHLLSPANNGYVNDLQQTFSWDALPSATNYIFQAFTSSNSPIAASLQSTPNNFVNYSFPSQGTYKWKVYAQNATSSTIASEATVIIDTITPATPIQISPLNDTNLVVDPVQLKWNSSYGATSYRLQVSTNPTSFTETDTVLTGTIYNFSTAAGTIYYWRVKAIHNQVSESAYTPAKSFRRN
jgi:hypothetical protein